MLVSIFALTQTTKTRAIKARVETHTLTFAYVIAQQARGLLGPGLHQRRVREHQVQPEREQHQAQAQVQRRKAAAQPCRWHTWAVLAREQQCW